MFRIQPINDRNEQIEVARECGSTYREGFFAYSMREENGDLMGFSQFDINGESAFISEIKPKVGLDDYEAMFILGRSTMNFIDMCGSHIAYASPDCADADFMKAIGFTEKDGQFYTDMTDYFSGCKH